MAKTKISEWSSTPANNTDIDSINIAEGCAPSGINDAIRELMAQVKDLYSGTSGDAIGVAGGGTGQTSYTNGQLLIGNTTGNTLTKATLTAGSGISVTNSTGSITIAATGAASQWTTTGSDIYYNTGNVGIRNTSPQTSLQVAGTGTASGGNAASSGYAALMLTDTTNSETYIHAVRPGVGWNNLNLGALTHTWRTNGGNVAMTLNSSNNLQLLNSLSVGNATPTTSGAGITFPATQSASTDANTLDDYEEGTWTPSVGGTATYSIQTGRYTKVGNLVYVSVNLVISSIGTGSTTEISGLPFTAGGTCTYSGYTNWFNGIASAQIYIFPRVGSGNTTINFAGITASSTQVNNVPTLFGSSAQIECAVVYRVA
jgi:hypothetical protein